MFRKTEEFVKEDIKVDHLKHCIYCRKVTIHELMFFTHIKHDVIVAKCRECGGISIEDVQDK